MAAVWMRLRADLRGRRRFFLGLVLIVAVIGGGALAAAAGARRTASAYPRFVDRYPGPDTTAETGRRPNTDQIFDAITHLPSVKTVSRRGLFIGRVRNGAGTEIEFPDVFLVAQTKPNTDIPRGFKLLAGRAPRDDASDELMASYVMAERLSVRPGDRLTVTVENFPGLGPTREQTSTYTVTGVYAAVGEFETLRAGGFPTTLAFSPAFLARHKDFRTPEEDQLGLYLREGRAGFAEFMRELRSTRIDVDGKPTPLSALNDGVPKPNTASIPAVESVNRTPAMTLALLASFLALALTVVTAQSIGRESTLRPEDAETLRALGMSPIARAAAELVRAGLVAMAGVAGAIVVAIALSPLTPVGLARIAEPQPGVSVDLVALGVGALALMVLIVLATIPAAIRAARHDVTRQRVRRSAIAQGMARTGASPSAVTGVALALDPGQGRASVPVRTTILGVAIAIALIVAALGFRASMDRLRSDPELSGFKYDAAVSSFEGPDAFMDKLRSIDVVEKVWLGAFFEDAEVGGLDPIPVTSYQGVSPALVSGRAPGTANEIALDGRTMRMLKVGIGDRVPVGSSSATLPDCFVPPRPMTVVGRFVSPRAPFIGDYPGQGAALTKIGAERICGGWDAAYVRFKPGTDLDQGVAVLRNELRGRVFAVVSRTTSVSARTVTSIVRVPLMLATALGLLGTATLIHTMLITVRRRRKDLAMLKTLGFVGGQVRAAVAWQATTIVGIALVIGVPLGIVLGRWGWRLFADQIEVVPLPIVPTLLIPGAVVIALAAGNLIAAFPARSAARTKPALVLRAE